MSSRLLVLPFLAMPFITAPAIAETTTALDTLVVTATRLDELLSLPANITVITADDIKNSPSRTLPELLSQEVGVNTTSLFSHGSRASVDLRGYGETAAQNTLILLDGRRLNDIDLSSVNFSAIPFENIERIEIVRGSGAVLYGDGASGGSINIITKDPRDSKTYATLSLTGGSFDHREANALMSYSDENFGITANIHSIDSDGFRDNNDFEQQNGQIDLRIPAVDGEVYMKLGAYRQELGLPGSRDVGSELDSDRKGTSTPNDWADEDIEFITLGYSADLNEKDSFVIDASYKNKEQQAEFLDYDGFGFHSFQDSTIETFSLTPRVNLEREIANLPVSWTFGADLYIHDYKSDRSLLKSTRSQPINKVDINARTLGLYGQGLFSLSNRSTLTLGWRSQKVRQSGHDKYDPTAPAPAFSIQGTAGKDKKTDFENSYELGIKHLISENWNIFGRVGRSVRFARVEEVYELHPSTFLPRFDVLKPQVSQDVEFGINYRNSWLGASVAVFHQDLENEIHLKADASDFQNVNLDDTKHQGVEIAFDAQVHPSLLLKANYTYLNAEFTAGVYDGNDIPQVPKHTYNLSAYADLPAGFKSAISWNYVSAAFFVNDLTNNFGKKIPSYQTVDLKISKKIAQLDLALQVNNLFDEEYYTTGISSVFTAGAFNAYPLPERNAYLSVSYTFD